MGKKTVRGHDIANRFVYSLKRARRSSFSFFIIVSLWYNRDIKIGICRIEEL